MSQSSDIQPHQRISPQHSSPPAAAPSKLTEQQLLLLQQQWAQTAPRLRSDQKSICSNRSSVSGLQYSRVRRPAQASTPGHSLTPYTRGPSFAGHIADTAPNTPQNTPANRGISFPGFIPPATSAHDPSGKTAPDFTQQQQLSELVVCSRMQVYTGEADSDSGDAPVGSLRARHSGAERSVTVEGDSPFAHSISSSNSTCCTPDTPARSPATTRLSHTYSTPGRVSTPSSKYACSNSSSSARIGGNFAAMLLQDSVHSTSTPATRTYSKMNSNSSGWAQQGGDGFAGSASSPLQPAFSTTSHSSFASSLHSTSSTMSASTSTPRRRGNATSSIAPTMGSHPLSGSFSSSTGSWTPQSSASSRVRTPFTPSAGSGPRGHRLSQPSLRPPTAAGYSAAGARAAAAALMSGSGSLAGYTTTRVSASGLQAGHSTPRVSGSGLQAGYTPPRASGSGSLAGHTTARVSASGSQAGYSTARVSGSGSLAGYTTTRISASGSQAGYSTARVSASGIQGPHGSLLAAAKAEHAALMAQLNARSQGGRGPSFGGNSPALPCSLSDLTSEVIDSLGSLQGQGSAGPMSGFRAGTQGSGLSRRLSHAGSVAGSLLGEERSFMASVPEAAQAAAAATGLAATAAAAPYDPATSWDTDSESGSMETASICAAMFSAAQQSLGYNSHSSSSTLRPATLQSISTAQVMPAGQSKQAYSHAQAGSRGGILARLFCLRSSGTLSPRAHSPRITQPMMTKKVRYGSRMSGLSGKASTRVDGGGPSAEKNPGKHNRAAAAALVLTQRQDSLTDHQPDITRAASFHPQREQEQQQQAASDFLLLLPQYVQPAATGSGQLHATTMLYNSSASPIYRFAGTADAGASYIPTATGGEHYHRSILAASGSRQAATPTPRSALSSAGGFFGTPEREGVPNSRPGGTVSWGGFAQPVSAAAALHGGGYAAAYSSRRGGSTACSVAAERAARMVAAQLQASEAARAASSGGSVCAGSALRPSPAATGSSTAAAAPHRLSELTLHQLQQLQLPLAAGTAASMHGSAAGSVVSEAVSGTTYRSGAAGSVAGSRRGGYESRRQLQAVYEKGQLCWKRPQQGSDSGYLSTP